MIIRPGLGDIRPVDGKATEPTVFGGARRGLCKKVVSKKPLRLLYRIGVTSDPSRLDAKM